MARKNNGATRNYSLVLYNIDDLKKIIASDKIKRYAYIYHDKDTIIDKVTGEVTDKQPHYHLYLNFYTVQRISWLDTMKKTQGFNENVLIEKCASPEELIIYFTHVYEPEKHKYEHTEIIANFDLKKLSNETELSEHLDIFLEIEKIVRQPFKYNWTQLFKRYPRLIYSANSLKTVASFIDCDYIKELERGEKYRKDFVKTVEKIKAKPKLKEVQNKTKTPFD